jgi:hypothetical protein
MAALIDKTLRQPDVDLSWVREAELLSDFLPAVKAKLLNEPKLLMTSLTGRILLSKMNAGEQVVDLSLFRNLSTEQLPDLTCELSKTIVSLSLSGPNITADLLRDIVSANPSLQKLYILGASNVSLEPALELLHDSNLDALYHSDMFRRAFEDATQKETSFPSQIITSFPVIQIFWVCRKLPVHNHLPPSSCAFPLRDANLPPARIVTGLVRLLHFLNRDSRLEASTVAMAAAKCFAMTGSAESDVLHPVSWQTL